MPRLPVRFDGLRDERSVPTHQPLKAHIGLPDPGFVARTSNSKWILHPSPNVVKGLGVSIHHGRAPIRSGWILAADIRDNPRKICPAWVMRRIDSVRLDRRAPPFPRNRREGFVAARELSSLSVGLAVERDDVVKQLQACL